MKPCPKVKGVAAALIGATGTTAAYLRVSGRSQDHAMQRATIESVAHTQGFAIDRWYAERASGKTMSRPELARLREDIRSGAVRHLVVFKLDRITRSGVADTYAFLAEARKAGCVVRAVADNLLIRPDTDDVVSEVLAFALSLAARIERTAINDRIAGARARKELVGGAWGRPPRMSPEQFRRAHDLKREGMSIRAIAQRVGVPRSTIHAALSGKVGAFQPMRAPSEQVADPPPVPV